MNSENKFLLYFTCFYF